MSEQVPGAARRARKRDSAERLGKLERGFITWLDTNPGQLCLILVALVALAGALSIGP